MDYSLPKPTAMQVIWLVRDYDRLHKLAEEATPEELKEKYIFRQMRAVDHALDTVTKIFRADVRQKLRVALILAYQDKENTWEKLDSGILRGDFGYARQRFIYEIASELELVLEEGKAGVENKSRLR